MDKNKILEMNITKEKEEFKKTVAPSFSLHTNPLIQKMLFLNLNNKKGKFKFKDLFR